MRFEEGSLGSEAIGSVPWKRTRIERARLNEIASFIDGSTVRTLLVVIRRSKQSTRNWNETPNRWLIAQDGPSPFCFRERFHAPLTFYQYFRFFTYNDFAVVSTFPRPLAISEIKQLSILFYLLPILSISRLKATAFDFLNRFDFPFDRSRCEEISRTKYNRRRTWSCVCVHVHTCMCIRIYAENRRIFAAILRIKMSKCKIHLKSSTPCINLKKKIPPRLANYQERAQFFIPASYKVG